MTAIVAIPIIDDHPLPVVKTLQDGSSDFSISHYWRQDSKEEFTTIVHSLREPRDAVRSTICEIIKQKILRNQLDAQLAEWSPLSVVLPKPTSKAKQDDCRGLDLVELGSLDTSFFMVCSLPVESDIHQQIRIGAVLLRINGRSIRGCSIRRIEEILYYEDDCTMDFAQPRELADITKMLERHDHAKRVVDTESRPKVDSWKHVSYTLTRENTMTPLGLGLMVMKKSPCTIVDELIPGTPAADNDRQIRMASQLLSIDGERPMSTLDSIRGQFRGKDSPTIEVREPPDLREMYRLCCQDRAFLTSIATYS